MLSRARINNSPHHTTKNNEREVSHRQTPPNDAAKEMVTEKVPVMVYRKVCEAISVLIIIFTSEWASCALKYRRNSRVAQVTGGGFNIGE
jgi:hypothetical protein